MTKDELKAAIKEALDEEIKPFYIDRERHYQDHQFLESLQNWVGSIGSATLKTLISTVVAGLLILLLLGFVFWGKKNF